jgi:pimeloyl-ACP methyl ester carboxylesterase
MSRLACEVIAVPEIKLSQGTLHYRDEGSGPVVLFIHGLLVDGQVWDRVVSKLDGSVRCIVPDLPLGSHRRPMNKGADLSPLGLAALIAELIERLELRDVTLVGNDTGGALCQLVAAHHPERLARLVLINCDAFEHFPPPAFALVVKALARVPGALVVLADLGRLRAVRRGTMAIAPLTIQPLPDDLLKAWVTPLRKHGVRHDLRAVLRHIDPSHTLDAAQRLTGFDRPALIVWGTRDKFFPISDAERLVAVLPDARLEKVDDARTFVQLDRPERVAELVGSFARGEALASA